MNHSLYSSYSHLSSRTNLEQTERENPILSAILYNTDGIEYAPGEELDVKFLLFAIGDHWLLDDTDDTSDVRTFVKNLYENNVYFLTTQFTVPAPGQQYYQQSYQQSFQQE